MLALSKALRIFSSISKSWDSMRELEGDLKGAVSQETPYLLRLRVEQVSIM